MAIQAPPVWIGIWTRAANIDPLRRLDGLIAAIQTEAYNQGLADAGDNSAAGYAQGATDALQAASQLAQAATGATLPTLPASILALIVRRGP